MSSTAIVVGNPRPGSRTWQAAHLVAEQLTGASADVDIDLATFGTDLLDWTSERVAAAMAAVATSSLVIVASPTYQGTYTGMLKLFLDRFPKGRLSAVKAVPLMLGGDMRHSLAPEVSLKPVLAEIGASSPTRGLFLVDAEWDTSPALAEWLPTARNQLALT